MIFDVMMWAREGSRVEGLLSYRADGYGFYTGPEWGPQILMDAWWQGAGDNSKLSDETSAEFAELFEFFLGKKIWVDADGHLLDQDTKEPLPEKVKARERYRGELNNSSGFSDGHHYLVLKPRSDDFRRRTREIIKSFVMEPQDHEQADFTIEVYDPRYLAHLETNTYFETAFVGHLP